jgi:hypothetical protein
MELAETIVPRSSVTRIPSICFLDVAFTGAPGFIAPVYQYLSGLAARQQRGHDGYY